MEIIYQFQRNTMNDDKINLQTLLELIDDVNKKIGTNIFVTSMNDLLQEGLYEMIYKEIFKDRYPEIAEIMQKKANNQ